MDQLSCVLCGACPFRHRGASATHRNTCIGNKRSCVDHNIASSSRRAGTSQSSEHIETNESIENNTKRNFARM